MRMSKYKLSRIGALLLGFALLLALSGSTSQFSISLPGGIWPFASDTGQYDCIGPGSASDSLGAQAIQPYLPGIPTFTKDDVRRYIQAHGSSGMRFSSVGKPTITRILFITSREACELMRGEYIGLPNDALVCYVELSGIFPFFGPFNSQPTIFHRVQDVFDARTGNLVVTGVGN
jgi:hypothetical protein